MPKELEQESPTIDQQKISEGIEPPDTESADPPSEDDSTLVEDDEALDSHEDDTDWRKRHGDAVRWAQREAQAKAELEARLREAEARMNQLKASGFDFDELDIQPSAPSGDYVPKKDFEGAVQDVRRELWNASKMIFITAHPEFKDPDLSRMLDYECSRIAEEEKQLTGSVTSSAEKLLKKGAGNLKKFVNRIKAQGQKTAQEKRRKINESGVTEGRDKAKKPEEPDFSPADAWVGAQRQRQQRIRSGA